MSVPLPGGGDVHRRDAGGQRLTIATLNTRGIPVVGSQLAERYGVIAEILETSAIDVVSFQEVFTYYHLSRLTGRMPSFRHVGYRPSAAGPAGGLVTFRDSTLHRDFMADSLLTDAFEGRCRAGRATCPITSGCAPW
jgi:hypothetical protein